MQSNLGASDLERLARLETSYKTLSAAVEEGFKGIRDELHQVVTDLNKQRRPNYFLWVGVIGLCFTLFTGLYSLMSLRMDAATTPLALGQKEIETQLDADAQLRSVENTAQQRLNYLLWSASALGKVTPYPVGPYFQPNVAAPYR